jgi:hypothetical protein
MEKAREIGRELAPTPFRARSVKLALQLLDLELQVRDQSLVVGEPGLGDGGVCFSDGGVGLGDNPPFALSAQRRLQRFNVVRKVIATGVHESDQIAKSAPCGAPFCKVIQKVAGLSRHCRTPRMRGIAPVDAGQEVAESHRRDRHRSIGHRGP